MAPESDVCSICGEPATCYCDMCETPLCEIHSAVDGIGDYVCIRLCKPQKPKSFEAVHGRKPVAVKDYDPDNICQDDYEYLTGTGRYRDADGFYE